MANEQNLRKGSKGHKLTPEEAIKGGINSGKARRERRTMREQMEMLLKLPLQDIKCKEEIKSMGITDDEIDNQMAVILSVYRKALTGDMKAVEVMRDTVGEIVIQKYQEVEPPKIVDDI